MVLFLYFWYNSDSSLPAIPADVPQGYSPGPLLFTYKLQPPSYRQFFFYTLEKEIRRWTTKLGAQVYVRPLKVLIYIRNYDVIMVPSSHIQEPNVLFISTKLPSIHFLPLILGFFQVTGVYKCTWHQETLDCGSLIDFVIAGNARQRLPFPRSSTPTISRALTAVRGSQRPSVVGRPQGARCLSPC